jgi:hypothetical protein
MQFIRHDIIPPTICNIIGTLVWIEYGFPVIGPVEKIPGGYNLLYTIVLLTEKFSDIHMLLANRIHQLDSIEVKVTGMGMIDLRNDVDFAATVHFGKLFDLPAFAETDVFRMLKVLPGISYPENSTIQEFRTNSQYILPVRVYGKIT